MNFFYFCNTVKKRYTNIAWKCLYHPT